MKKDTIWKDRPFSVPEQSFLMKVVSKTATVASTFPMGKLKTGMFVFTNLTVVIKSMAFVFKSVTEKLRFMTNKLKSSMEKLKTVMFVFTNVTVVIKSMTFAFKSVTEKLKTGMEKLKTVVKNSQSGASQNRKINGTGLNQTV